MRLILVPPILSSLSLSRSPTLTLSHSVLLSLSLSLYPLTFFLIFLSQRRWWSLWIILKLISKTPLLTRGPLALFFGGQEIIPLLSSDSSSNMLIIILVILSPVLQLLVHLYKKIRFRKEIKYEQQLQQAVMSGVRNAYRPIIIFIGFLGIGVSALNSPISKDVCSHFLDDYHLFFYDLD